MIYVIFGAMAGVIVLLLVKLHLIKKSAREITSELGMILKEDTNTSLRLSTHDRDMCRLADSINVQLKQVRKEHLQYHQGNTELKTAITNISHDIRTPLTAIAGNLYMIGKTDDLSEIREYIAVIAERTETMKQLTEELFRYSMIVSNESREDTEEVFVNQVLANNKAACTDCAGCFLFFRHCLIDSGRFTAGICTVLRSPPQRCPSDYPGGTHHHKRTAPGTEYPPP